MKSAARGKIRQTKSEDPGKAIVVNAIVNGKKTVIRQYDTSGPGVQESTVSDLKSLAHRIHIQVGGDPGRILKTVRLVFDLLKNDPSLLERFL